MILRIYEELPNNPNEVVNDAIDSFVKILKDNDVEVLRISYSDKTIFLTRKDYIFATDLLDYDYEDYKQLGIRVAVEIEDGIRYDIPDPRLENSGVVESLKEFYDVVEQASYYTREALNNLQQGLLDFDMDIDSQWDTPKFWSQFTKQMKTLGIGFDVKESNKNYGSHYYYMHIWEENDDLDFPRR